MTRKLLMAIMLGAIITTSCKKSLDINIDPNNPSTIEVSKLLPTAIINLGNSLAMGSGLSQILSVYTHQQSTREEPDQYGATGSDFFIQQAWTFFYENTVNNIEQIIRDASAAGNSHYTGIARVLKAYSYSQWVDVFGDVPYSESSQLIQGVRYPKFDDDAAIYPQLFLLLDSAINDLSTDEDENILLPGSDDLIYGGNIEMWIKAFSSWCC